MKRSIATVSLVVLCLFGTAFGQVFNNNYYFSPNSLPNYTDVTTVKATQLVNEDEIITVGFAREPLNSSKNDIVLVKTKSNSGTVIWANRYGLEGLDEKAYGLTVSYDKKHVIVVGTAQNPEALTDWNGLAMKIEISTGNVIWSVQYGKTGTYEELRMVDRSYNTLISFNPTYLAVGSSSDQNVKAILYGVSIFDFNGNQQWANRYLELSTFNLVNDYAYTMVRNPDNRFFIAGTRYEVNKPSRIFTIGLNQFTGALSDKYVWYGVDEDRHSGGAICNIRTNEDGMGLAFSTFRPGVENGVDNAITVMRLDKNRKPKWINYYWQQSHKNNHGLAIYQSVEETELLNVYTNTFKSVNNPGFLALKDNDGDVKYFIKYNFNEQNNNKFATAMVQTKFGYTAKALHRDGENGFLLAGLKPSGKTECAEEEKMEVKRREAKFDSRDYNPYSFGAPERREIKKESVHGKAEKCDGTGGYSFRLAQESLIETNEVVLESRVYPNPVASDQSTLTLEYTAPADQQVEIRFHNALGQQIYVKNVTLNEGNHVINLDATVLSTGINLVTIYADGEVLYQNKVVRK